MKNKNLFALAALAGLGLSACSQNPQSIPAADALTTSVPSPHNQQVAQLPSQQAYAQIPQADPLVSHLPAAVAPRHYAQAAPNAYGYNPQVAAPRIPNYLPPQRPQQPPQLIAQAPANGGMPRLSQAELRAIGGQIFNNEGGGNIHNLAHWNDGEDFAAMGIGHFTWYPAGRRQSFGNTFPGLLDYMAQNGVQLPDWLQQARHQGVPWRNRQEFLRAKNSGDPRVVYLQQMLASTQELQAQYIVDRTRAAMPKLVKASSGNMQQHVARNLNAVANTPGGWYALIDYVNFKGEGLGNGGYKGQSWGLRQVLEEMRPAQPGQSALHEFADAATRVLQRRVQNSDPSRNEARWLPGWRNRVNTYRNPIA